MLAKGTVRAAYDERICVPIEMHELPLSFGLGAGICEMPGVGVAGSLRCDGGMHVIRKTSFVP